MVWFLKDEPLSFVALIVILVECVERHEIFS